VARRAAGEVELAALGHELGRRCGLVRRRRAGRGAFDGEEPGGDGERAREGDGDRRPAHAYCTTKIVRNTAIQTASTKCQ
jgi:hypothetical protein